MSFVGTRLRYNGMRFAGDSIAGEQDRYAVRNMAALAENYLSLGRALAKIPMEFSLASTVDFRVVVNGRAAELEAGVCEEVYRIAREAILNAYRHSGASEIEAEIVYRSGELRIAVRDNGCGIDPREMHWGRNGYLGLRGMREGAGRIGAQFSLFSKVTVGTEVEVRVPGRVAFQQGLPLGKWTVSCR